MNLARLLTGYLAFLLILYWSLVIVSVTILSPFIGEPLYWLVITIGVSFYGSLLAVIAWVCIRDGWYRKHRDTVTGGGASA